jgi:putative PIN family toxin of toxin-antitoxin system
MALSRRWVLDTNVVLGAILFPESIAARALTKAKSGVILASDSTREELREVVVRERFDRYVVKPVREKLAAEFDRACRVVQIRFPIRACRDPKDDKFLEVAVHGRADAIVTWDRHLLDLNPFRGIAILTPAAYLDLK